VLLNGKKRPKDDARWEGSLLLTERKESRRPMGGGKNSRLWKSGFLQDGLGVQAEICAGDALHQKGGTSSIQNEGLVGRDGGGTTGK